MSAILRAVGPRGPLHRIGRSPDAWALAPWTHAGPDGTFGNRYDDPAGEYRVLYAAGQRRGAFLEALSRFRIDLRLVAEMMRSRATSAMTPTRLSVVESCIPNGSRRAGSVWQ